MLYLICYDVNTLTKEGRKRLRLISKTCCNYGQRVQNSVFECNLNANEYLEVKKKLLATMDDEEDSLRLYNLGKKYTNKTEHYGVKESLDLEGELIL